MRPRSARVIPLALLLVSLTGPALADEVASSTCEVRTPAASWQRQVTVGAACGEAWPCDGVAAEIGAVTAALGWTSCVAARGPVTAGGDGGAEPGARAIDWTAVLAGEPLPRQSYVRFERATGGGEALPLALVVRGFVQDPVPDSYLAAAALVVVLGAFDWASGAALVPSAEAAARVEAEAAEAARVAAVDAELAGLTPEQRDALAAERLCRAWNAQDPSLDFQSRLDAALAAEPILTRTDWPGVLWGAAMEVRPMMARKVAEMYGLVEVCEGFNSALAGGVEREP